MALTDLYENPSFQHGNSSFSGGDNGFRSALVKEAVRRQRSGVFETIAVRAPKPEQDKTLLLLED